jgi:hypothetical protein
MSSCIAPAQPIAPRMPYSFSDTLIALLKHLIPVPLSMFQVRKLRVPETISAETVKVVTKAYERKSLHLSLLRSRATKGISRNLGFERQGAGGASELTANCTFVEVHIGISLDLSSYKPHRPRLASTGEKLRGRLKLREY